MGSLQEEMKRKLRTRLDRMVDNIDPALVPQAHEMLGAAERQLGIENGNNNSEGEIDPRGGEITMEHMTEEQTEAKKHILSEARKAGLKVEVLNDRAMSKKEAESQIRAYAKDAGLDIKVGDKQLADDEGFIAGFFGSRTRAKVIAGNTFEFFMKGAIIVACVAGGFWVLRKLIGDQVPMLPASQESMH